MKLFKRFICLIFILTMLPLSAFALPEPPLIEASAYLIAERNSNTLLLEHNIDEKLFPASITKLTNALVAVNHLKPDDVLNVKKRSEERREGKECTPWCTSRGAPSLAETNLLVYARY